MINRRLELPLGDLRVRLVCFYDVRSLGDGTVVICSTGFRSTLLLVYNVVIMLYYNGQGSDVSVAKVKTVLNTTIR